MRTVEFVQLCKEERDALLVLYSGPPANSAVGLQLDTACLTPEQRRAVLSALDLALTDAFYTMLMGLAGAASLGGVQQAYRVADEHGRPISPSSEADLEHLTHQIFQEGP